MQLCGSGFCTVPFHLLPKTYICLSRQVIQWPPYGWCRGVAASLLLSITTNGTGFGGVQYILASASGYNISSFAVFLSARTSGRHCLLSVVVLLVIYSRRWRSLGAGLDPRLVYVSFFVSSFLCNNPFIRMRNHLLILLKTDHFVDKKLLIYTIY